MPTPMIVPETERAAPLSVGGFFITVLAADTDTGGNEFFHQRGEEGKGPGPHFHPWDETFYVLEGELHCGVAGVETVAVPGTLVHVPGGTIHWFRFGKGGCAMLTVTSAGNAARMFTDFDKGVTWESPDRAQLIALAAKHGQIIVTS